MQPKTGVKPARHSRYDADLSTRVLGVHGFRAECDCGIKLAVRDTWAEASRDAKVHRGWHKLTERGL